MITRPFSQACENNKAPILSVLLRLLPSATSVLEVGSGTGQHAVHFAQHLPHLQWQSSDRACNHAGIHAWIDDALQQDPSSSVPLRPLELDVLKQWPTKVYDAIYSANTAHIMPWQAVVALFEQSAKHLADQGLFILYGPFNYHGQFTSESNARFDQHLKSTQPEQGIRDFENIIALAQDNQLTLLEDNTMPANNRLLVFKKVDANN